MFNGGIELYSNIDQMINKRDNELDEIAGRQAAKHDLKKKREDDKEEAKERKRKVLIKKARKDVAQRYEGE